MTIASTGYQTGFGNEFATEALPGTLPVGRNSPQHVAHGLYAEQLTGTAFTAPRHQNRRSWLYRIRPAAVHGTFEPFAQPAFHNDFGSDPVSPEKLRWNPLPLPQAPCDHPYGSVGVWVVVGATVERRHGDHQLFQRLAAAGQRAAAAYDWQILGDELYRFYHALAAAPMQ